MIRRYREYLDLSSRHSAGGMHRGKVFENFYTGLAGMGPMGLLAG